MVLEISCVFHSRTSTLDIHMDGLFDGKIFCSHPLNIDNERHALSKEKEKERVERNTVFDF